MKPGEHQSHAENLASVQCPGKQHGLSPRDLVNAYCLVCVVEPDPQTSVEVNLNCHRNFPIWLSLDPNESVTLVDVERFVVMSVVYDVDHSWRYSALTSALEVPAPHSTLAPAFSPTVTEFAYSVVMDLESESSVPVVTAWL